MTPDWFTNYIYFSGLLPSRHPLVWAKLDRILLSHGIGFHLLDATKDVWCRDYLPVQVANRRFVKFVYDPDYLREYPELVTDEGVLERIPEIAECRRSDLVLDGGNVVGTSKTAILTDKVFRENPSRTEAEIVLALQELLEVERIVIIPTDPDDEIGHADGVVRFLDEERVMMNDYAEVNVDYGKQVGNVLRRAGFEIETLPHFFERYKRNGISLAAGYYVNYLRLESLVLVPAYGRPEDDEAVRRLERLIPSVPVIPVPCLELARDGGVLNCVSWTLTK